ncbi:NAD(P)/FAD-dependent oxidoreductase [Nonlabens antarcticus]|uniref:NAD(P)/FAD-dependent oxidoreductase n=1 Tax=Nonlabens antarcticus TaxID=392714 RepID=UPI0018915351|nr:FAD-dependent oxidoreductase [Nonlabens antarcticus]
MKDVIIVGGGIAGCTLAWQWHLQGKSILWIADDTVASSHVAAGVFNPVVLKRFSPVWNAQEQLDLLFPFYTQVQSYLSEPLLHLKPVWRRLHDEKERKTWTRKSMREDLDNLMVTNPIDDSIEGIEAPYGYGMVNHTGWLDTNVYMQGSFEYFKKREEFELAIFDYAALNINKDHVTYQDREANAIIFAEGIRLPENPWFKNLPLQGNKGEILIIKCAGLKLDQIIKSSVFLMPFKEDLFWVGATYDRDYIDSDATEVARDYLISKLDTFLKIPYEIVDQKSGIRPTTVDRRPFVGNHPELKNLYVFNGMGSRASLVAPWASKLLFEKMYTGTEMPAEMDISRFQN